MANIYTKGYNSDKNAYIEVNKTIPNYKTSSAIGTLGQLPFVCSSDYVLTFNDLKRDIKTRWAKHDVIGAKPRLEWIGEELLTVTLSIRFDSSLGITPMEGLSRLKKMAENRKYKTLIIGGEILGRYVIESISENRKIHDGRGNCIIATADISLLEWSSKSQVPAARSK